MAYELTAHSPTSSMTYELGTYSVTVTPSTGQTTSTCVS